MKKDYKRRRFLMQELKAYEKITPMTEEERAILHEWVRAGHSVHENDAMAVYEGGCPLDFLVVYREQEEVRRTLASMTHEEGSRYLLEEYDIDRDGVMTPHLPTYEELAERARRLYRACFLYGQFLSANDLRNQADEYVKEHFDEEMPFDTIDTYDWDIEREEA